MNGLIRDNAVAEAWAFVAREFERWLRGPFAPEDVSGNPLRAFGAECLCAVGVGSLGRAYFQTNDPLMVTNVLRYAQDAPQAHCVAARDAGWTFLTLVQQWSSGMPVPNVLSGVRAVADAKAPWAPPARDSGAERVLIKALRSFAVAPTLREVRLELVEARNMLH